MVSGGHSGGETPVPIPNTEVKPARANGTWGETPWESRSSPEYFSDWTLVYSLNREEAGVLSRPRVNTPTCPDLGAEAHV